MPRDLDAEISVIVDDLIASMTEEEIRDRVAQGDLHNHIDRVLAQYADELDASAAELEQAAVEWAKDADYELRNTDEKAELAEMTEQDWAELYEGMSAVEYQHAGDDHTERELTEMVGDQEQLPAVPAELSEEDRLSLLANYGPAGLSDPATYLEELEQARGEDEDEDDHYYDDVSEDSDDDGDER